MNPIRQTLGEGRPSIGTWLSLASNLGAEFVGGAGYDWVLIDLQHSGATWDNLLPLIQAVQLGGSPALVRVSHNNPTEIGRALDLGAIGVVVPMVSTAEEARLAVSAMQHAPRGIRSFGQIRGSSGYAMSADQPTDDVCALMIETAEGFDNVDEIAAVPGVDALFVGPADLALSQERELDDSGMRAESLEAVGAVIDAAIRHGKAGGTPSLSYDHAAALTARGARFLTVGSDAGHVIAGMRRDVEQIARLKAASGTGVAAR